MDEIGLPAYDAEEGPPLELGVATPAAGGAGDAWPVAVLWIPGPDGWRDLAIWRQTPPTTPRPIGFTHPNPARRRPRRGHPQEQ